MVEQSEYQDHVVIRINGNDLRGFVSSGFERAINTIADTFSFTAPYNPDDLDSRNLDPYTYHPVDIFIDSKLFMSGVAENWKPDKTAESSLMTISGRSKAGVLCDCPSPDAKLNYVKKTIKQIADSLLKPFGISFEIPFGDSGIINNCKREPAEKIFEFLAKLAAEKGFILNSTPEGNIKLDRANISGTPILNLVQGDPNIVSIDAEYSGTQRFSSYKANSQTRGNPKNSSEITDSTIPVNRPIIFEANNNDQGQIKDAATWERARSLARSARMGVKIFGWRDKNNQIILENNTVTLYAPNSCIFNETKYLIEKVTFDMQGGKHASLSLVLPQSYTLDFPKVMPWKR